MTYTRAALERAMKVHEVLVQALKDRQPWIRVADTLGVNTRTVRRWRYHYEQSGFDGLFDHRRRTPSPRAVPVADLQRLLRLYAERYHGFNVRHFHQVVCRDYGVPWSYTFVKKALQAAHLVGKRRRALAAEPCSGRSRRLANCVPFVARQLLEAMGRRAGSTRSRISPRWKGFVHGRVGEAEDRVLGRVLDDPGVRREMPSEFWIGCQPPARVGEQSQGVQPLALQHRQLGDGLLAIPGGGADAGEKVPATTAAVVESRGVAAIDHGHQRVRR